MVTDAGLPGVSDPGMRLVRACRAAGLPFTVLPGASAPALAWIGSGLADEEGFFFGGFLPPKSGGREREVRRARGRGEAGGLVESPPRRPPPHAQRTLDLLAALAPEREVCVARELTKKFEEYRRAPAAAVAAHYQAKPAKGEITLVIAGAGRKVRSEP